MGERDGPSIVNTTQLLDVAELEDLRRFSASAKDYRRWTPLPARTPIARPRKVTARQHNLVDSFAKGHAPFTIQVNNFSGIAIENLFQ